MTIAQVVDVAAIKTAQEIFTYVLTFLREQKFASTKSDRHACAYRGDFDMKCAVGCLISDDEYDPEIEGKSFNNLDQYASIKAMYYRFKPHLLLLNRLQIAHDSLMPSVKISNARSITQSLAQWEDRMENIAEDFGIMYTEKEKS